MRILPNPAKEARNRAKHGWSFERVGEIFASPTIEELDDRPLGYEQEGRVRVIGRIGAEVVFLVFEPVEVEGGEIAARPISLRRATRRERQDYWRVYG